MSSSWPTLGLSSYIFRWAVGTRSFRPPQPADAFSLLEKACALGVQSVQFSDNLPLHPLTPAERRRLLRLAEDLGLAIGLGITGLEPVNLKQYLEMGSELGVGFLRLVPGTTDPAALESTIRQLLPTAHSLAVGIALETHADLRTSQLAQVVRSIDDSLVRICLDTANSLGQLELPSEFIPALAPLAVQLHLKDYAVEPMEIGHHITGRPLGEGRLDLEMVRQSLLAGGSRPEVLLELWTDPADTVEATLVKEQVWTERSVRRAREWLKGLALTDGGAL